VLCLPFLALAGWVWLPIGLLAALLPAEWCGRRLGGHTGDTYGACVVVAEASFLLLMAVAYRLA